MKLSMDEIRLMNALEKISGANAKDCLVSDGMVSFLVNERDVGKAIGKKASNARALEESVKKRIEIIGFQENPEEMVKKALEIETIGARKDSEKIVIRLDSMNKRKLLKKSAKLKRVREFIKRNFNLNLTVN
ncbi:MAG: NusA-like transcription termination signal-binding factor [Candidatus Diapherotrites archaeon]|nr:NusA-like transcription termination signal-binding factor [Candidatus Diapherotrites archaeon]